MKVKQFDVSLYPINSNATVRISAKNEAEAEKIALSQKDNLEFKKIDGDLDFIIESVEVKEKK